MSLTYNNCAGEPVTVVAMRNKATTQETLRSLQTGQTVIWCLPLAIELLNIPIEEEPIPEEVEQVLNKFPDFFEEPTGLPQNGAMIISLN